MALYANVLRTGSKILPSSIVLCRHIMKSQKCSAKTIDLNIDSIDDLTTHLIQKQSCKWDRIQSQSKLYEDQGRRIEPSEVATSDDQLNELFKKAANNVEALEELILKCRSLRYCPPSDTIRQILMVNAQKGNCDIIIKIIDLCKEVEPSFARVNSNFGHYLAEAIWIRGNIQKSLQLFEKIYTENDTLRRYIRTILNHLFLNKLEQNSEAVLRGVIKFSENINRKFEDPYFLITVWQICFLSEWFTDQCIALDLLEKNVTLWHNVIKRLPVLINIALGGHQTEIVYRLLQMLLRRRMKNEYELILHALFDYKLSLRDIKGCQEIIQWSKENGVTLSSFQVEHFLHLMLCDNICIDARKTSNQPKYKFKF